MESLKFTPAPFDADDDGLEDLVEEKLKENDKNYTTDGAEALSFSIKEQEWCGPA